MCNMYAVATVGSSGSEGQVHEMGSAAKGGGTNKAIQEVRVPDHGSLGRNPKVIRNSIVY
jgi:hypothetical protein